MSAPWLSRLKVAGFRSLRDVDVSFPPGLTVLIGPNGAGKSNLLAALRLLATLGSASLRATVAGWGGASAVLHYGPKVSPELALSVEFAGDETSSSYRVRLGHTATDAFTFLEESISISAPPEVEPVTLALGVGHSESLLWNAVGRADTEPDLRTAAQKVAFLRGHVAVYHFHDTSPLAALRQNHKRSDDRVLHRDGGNLASFLYFLARSDPDDFGPAWQRINELTRRVAPYIKRLEPDLVDPSRPDTSAVRLYWVDERDHRFDVSDLSDGTLRAIALITALAQPSRFRPRFIAIDEPELGLHPAALSLVVALARSISHETQVLFSTQSPALLDEFEIDETLVADRADGASRFRRLSAEALEAWVDTFTLSEIYAKNLIGGLP